MDTALPPDHRDETGNSTASATQVSATRAQDAAEDREHGGAAAGASAEAGGAQSSGGQAADREAFDDAIRKVLASSGGELLFRIPAQPGGSEEIAAVRLGEGEARMLALVILPQGAPLRVEPVEDSANPLAPVVQSYASLVDVWKAAA